MRFCRLGFFHEGLEEKFEVHEGKIKELKEKKKRPFGRGCFYYRNFNFARI
jgi:hypothetical protein